MIRKKPKKDLLEHLCDDVVMEICLFIPWEFIERDVIYINKYFHNLVWCDVFISRIFKLIQKNNSKKVVSRLLKGVWTGSKCMWCPISRNLPRFECEGDGCKNLIRCECSDCDGEQTEGFYEQCICQFRGNCINCKKALCKRCYKEKCVGCKEIVCEQCISRCIRNVDDKFICHSCSKRKFKSFCDKHITILPKIK